MICFWKYFTLLIIIQLGSSQILQKYTVGVLGVKWFNILSQKLIERQDDNRVILKLLSSNDSIPFYEDILINMQQLNKLNINLVLGDSSLSLAQTAAYLRIPYISVDPYISLSDIPEYSNMPHFYSLPIPEKIYSMAVINILNSFQIKKVSVIIDSSVDYDSFVKPLFEQKLINIHIWTLDNKITNDISKLQNYLDNILEESRDIEVWDFIIKAKQTVVKSMILRAKYYGMLVQPNKWYIPSFVCYDINIASIRQINSNITIISEECTESIIRQSSNYTDSAIINKAIQFFRKVNWELTPEKFNKVLKIDNPKRYDINGLQTESRFSMHSINIDETKPENLRLVGSWMYIKNKPYFQYYYKSQFTDVWPSTNYHIRVSAVEEHPHLIVLSNGSMVGFGVDLLNELSKMMNFTYTINLTNTVGSKEHSNWTGIVGEIQQNRADISLGPLVQTREIEEVLDFSTSFKQREISLVMRKSSPSTSLFQFFSPFSTTVWMVCIGSLIIIALVLWGVEHVHNKYFKNDDDIKFNLKESSWFSIACFLKQQIEIFPKSIPGRVMHYLLIFFSLIIITSYTANLAAFLTIKVYPNPINSIDDLANLPINSKIIFGTVQDSPILEFFEQSEMETYRKIYKLMSKNLDWLVNDTRHGYKRALSEPYVFIWDDSVNQYEIFSEPEYECNLISVGRPFGKRSFSIGMKFDSKLMKNINLNILHIIESGKRENLEKKWWTSKSICFASENPADSQEPLSIAEVAGVFLIVVLGAVVSIGWLAVQIICYKMKEKKTRKIQKNYLKNHPSIENDDAPTKPLRKTQV